MNIFTITERTFNAAKVSLMIAGLWLTAFAFAFAGCQNDGDFLDDDDDIDMRDDDRDRELQRNDPVNRNEPLNQDSNRGRLGSGVDDSGTGRGGNSGTPASLNRGITGGPD